MREWIRTSAMAVLMLPTMVWAQQGKPAVAGDAKDLATSSTQAAPTNIDPEALPIIEGMFQFLAAQPNMHLVFEDTIDKVTEDGKVVTLTHRREAFLHRPDKVKLKVTGDEDQESFYFDGTRMVLVVEDEKVFAQKEFTGGVDKMLEMAAKEYGIRRPILTLLRSDAAGEVREALTYAKYLGDSVIGGHECSQVLLSNGKFDYQIWIDKGARPLPRKLTIHYRGFEGEPRYTFQMLEFFPDAPPDEGFYRPADIKGLDEIPFEPAAESKNQ